MYYLFYLFLFICISLFGDCLCVLKYVCFLFAPQLEFLFASTKIYVWG